MALQSLRRDPALVPLSHDHHDGLMAAVRLKKGRSAYSGEPDIAESIRQLWEDDLCAHFEQEEQVLFAREWPAEIREMVDRAIEEHRQMRALVDDALKKAPSEELVRRLGELLESHIRFEERVMFGAMQSQLTEEEIAAIGSAIAAMRRPKACRTRPRGDAGDLSSSRP
jgi:iron-sulfur cluster repair protein YtfE (RIC family)